MVILNLLSISFSVLQASLIRLFCLSFLKVSFNYMQLITNCWRALLKNKKNLTGCGEQRNLAELKVKQQLTPRHLMLPWRKTTDLWTQHSLERSARCRPPWHCRWAQGGQGKLREQIALLHSLASFMSLLHKDSIVSRYFNEIWFSGIIVVLFKFKVIQSFRWSWGLNFQSSTWWIT